MKKNDLHELIASLTKSEKRYFKLQCRRQGTDGNYLRLFEVLEKQMQFDEVALRAQFPGAIFLQQLHVTKNYLREKILESLRQFHSQMSKDAAMKDLLRNVEILFYKELYGQARIEIRRAETLSVTYELHTAQIEVCRWKRRIEQALHPNRYDGFAGILQEQQHATEALQNNLAHWQAIVHISLSAPSGERSAVAQLPEEALSLESKVLSSNTKYLHDLRNGRAENAEAALAGLIRILEQHPHRVQEDPVSYITTVNNLAGFYVFGGEKDKALELFSRTRDWLSTLGIPDGRRPVLKQIMRAANIELEIYRNAADPARHEAYYRGMEVFVQRLSPKMPVEYLLSFHFQFAWISFLKQDYDQALNWLNRPLNDWRKYKQYFLYRYLLLLNLMVHVERRNLFVLRYFVDNARRLFKQLGQIQPYEQELLHFFSRIGQLPESERKGLYRDLQFKLFPEHGDPLVPEDALRMMDFRRWLQKKG